MPSIDIRQLVNSVPGVLSGGGSNPVMSGVFLTTNSAVQVGTALSFPTYASVAAFFGSSAQESISAAQYFAGFDNSTVKPSVLKFWRYVNANVAAFLRGGSLGSMTLDQLKAIGSGTLIATVDGTLKTASSIALGSATSFSNAATLITTAFTSGVTCTYDSQRNAFVLTSATTGATSTITYCTGTLATALFMTQATGAVLSQGAAATTPAASMDALLLASKNWATFSTLFEPLLADKQAFATWTSQRTDRVYFAWDTDIGATQTGNTSNFGYLAKIAQYNGVAPLYNRVDDAAFWMGTTASINFNQTNGRIAFSYRSQAGLVPAVYDDTVYANLIANGYNFYGSFSNNTDTFSFAQSGAIPGMWKWLDEYINQIYLNAQLETALINLLINSTSLPYNIDGYNAIRAACADPIRAAKNFGSIRAGVTLTQAQKNQINGAVGFDVSNEMFTEGYYLQISDADGTTRTNRTSPPISLWYMSGGSMRTLSMASIDVL